MSLELQLAVFEGQLADAEERVRTLRSKMGALVSFCDAHASVYGITINSALTEADSRYRRYAPEEMARELSIVAGEFDSPKLTGWEGKNNPKYRQIEFKGRRKRW